MKHSVECIKLFKEWEEKYPNYCRNCNGAGGFYFSGTRWIPPDFAECDECIGQGKCPLCGEKIGEGIPLDCFLDETILPCGHTYENPEAPYCICEGEPICPNDSHLMKYKETVWIDGMYEVQVFVCPECGEEVRW